MNIIPISKFQEQFWYLHKLAPKSAAYNIPLVFELDKLPNIILLEKAISIIIERHDVLRSNFRWHNFSLTQIIKQSDAFMFSIELQSFNQYSSGIGVPQEVLEEVNKPFQLDNSPLLRVKIFEYQNIIFLSFVFHHIIIDIHSKIIFESELTEIYNSLLSGKTPRLNTAYKQYQEYCTFSNEWLESKEAQMLIKDWLLDLPSVNSLVNLPNDYPRPKINMLEGNRIYFKLSEHLSTRIKESSNHAVTKDFVFLLSCYTILLFKLSQQDIIVIGVPLSNRRQKEYEYTFGVFVNSLPIAIDFSLMKNFSDVIKQVRQKLLFAHRKQEIPFVSIAQSSQNRNTSHNPYFQTGFAFEPRMCLELEGVKTKSISVERSGSQLDLFLTFWEENEQYNGFWEYSTNLFKRSTIDRFHQQFLNICEDASNNLEYDIRSKNILTILDYTILNQFNNSEIFIAQNSILDLIHKQTIKYSNKTAINCGNESITFEAFAQKTDQLVYSLKERYIKPNDIIGICMDRSINMLITMHAVLKLGATFLPLDPDFPFNRICYMLEDSGAILLISDENNVNRFTDWKLETITYNSIVTPCKSPSKGVVKAKINTNSNAYMMYTSGSTGKPKGIKIHHEALLNFILSMSKIPGFSSQDTLLSTTTPSFDISILEYFLPLANGGTLILAQKQDVMDGDRLIKLIDKHNVSFFQATPERWKMLIKNRWHGNMELKALCGGERLTSNLVNELLPKVSELWNMYGPTETTIWSTCARINSAEQPITVGQPIDNTKIRIISKENIYLPVGCTGEVCIGGKGVAKGYHNRTELSSEKFVTNADKEVYYRTGDLGRIRSDLNLEIFGRMDNQIKLRGYRIEPGEIEQALCSLTEIHEAVIKIHKTDENDQRLIAFIVPNEMEKLTAKYISSILRKKVPDYMVPSIYQVESDFPKTPNGKIDRDILKYQDDKILRSIHSVNANNDQKSDHSEIEKTIQTIWEKHLNITHADIHENLFDLGGTSITMMQIASEINETFSTVVNIVEFFDKPNIKAFSAYMNNLTKTINLVPSKNIGKDKRYESGIRRKRIN